MAYTGPTIAVADSSPSSVSGQSPRDTPATKLTHLSPNGIHTSQKLASSLNNAREPPLFHLQPYQGNEAFWRAPSMFPSAIEQDPFLSNHPNTKKQTQDATPKLSATATIFQPRDQRTPPSAFRDQQISHSGGGGEHSAVPADIMTRRENQNLHDVGLPTLQFSDHPRPSVSTSLSRLPLEMWFVAGPSRYIMVAGLPSQCPRIYLDALLAVPLIAQSRIAVSDHIVPFGMVILRYDDVRFAEMALTKIGSEFPTWTSAFVTSQCWLSFAKAICDPPASEFEGQVLVTIFPPDSSCTTSLSSQADHFAAVMHARLSHHGEVRSVSCMLTTATMVALKVEFYSLAATNSPGLEDQSSPFPGLRLSVIRYGVASPSVRTQRLETSMRLMETPDAGRSIQPITTPSEPHMYNYRSDRLVMKTNLTRIPNKWTSPISRSLDSPSANHNVVDIERIRQGQDVRTTIMLRNIPNKVDQPMLKEIVDETSRGRYDFMYLRIDFANNCNVGYAFINFEDSQYIIDFVEAVAGKRWNRFNSDKVAEVSYATIQGKDCLVQKFRNSSVMLEAPLFRPKIFHTGDGPIAGQEEKFPAPDNHSKMRRSLENAEHVGLFAPRVGQRFRDEQRRRRSRYDRGTRLAEIEEFGHEDDMHPQPNLLNFPPRPTLYPLFQHPTHKIY